MKGREAIIGFIGRVFLSLVSLAIILFYLDVPFNLVRSVNVILLLYVSFYTFLLVLYFIFPRVQIPYLMLLILDIVFALVFIYSTGLIYSPFIFLFFLISFSTSSLRWIYAVMIHLLLLSIFITLCFYYNRLTHLNKLPPLVDEKFWHRFQGTTSTISVAVLFISLLFIDVLLRRLHRAFSYTSMKKTIMLSNIPLPVGFYTIEGKCVEASDYFIQNKFDTEKFSQLIREVASHSHLNVPRITSFAHDGKNYELSIYPINYSPKKTKEVMVLLKEVLTDNGESNIFDKFSLQEILHEIKNPLTVISTAIEKIKENKNVYDIVTCEIEQIKNFINALEKKEYRAENMCRFATYFNEMLAIYKYQFDEKKITMEYFIPDREYINIHSNHLKHILHNIFSNIVKYATNNTPVYCIGYVEYNIENARKKFHIKFKNQTCETHIKKGSGLNIIRTLLQDYQGVLYFSIQNGIAITEVVV
ncbi:MAG: sensor histidine kinase [Planctomycetota bacterium]